MIRRLGGGGGGANTAVATSSSGSGMYPYGSYPFRDFSTIAPKGFWMFQIWVWLSCCRTVCRKNGDGKKENQTSVPDPEDPHGFGPPGSGSWSVIFLRIRLLPSTSIKKQENLDFYWQKEQDPEPDRFSEVRIWGSTSGSVPKYHGSGTLEKTEGTSL